MLILHSRERLASYAAGKFRLYCPIGNIERVEFSFGIVILDGEVAVMKKQWCNISPVFDRSVKTKR